MAYSSFVSLDRIQEFIPRYVQTQHPFFSVVFRPEVQVKGWFQWRTPPPPTPLPSVGNVFMDQLLGLPAMFVLESKAWRTFDYLVGRSVQQFSGVDYIRMVAQPVDKNMSTEGVLQLVMSMAIVTKEPGNRTNFDYMGDAFACMWNSHKRKIIFSPLSRMRKFDEEQLELTLLKSLKHMLYVLDVFTADGGHSTACEDEYLQSPPCSATVLGLTLDQKAAVFQGVHLQFGDVKLGTESLGLTTRNVYTPFVNSGFNVLSEAAVHTCAHMRIPAHLYFLLARTPQYCRTVCVGDGLCEEMLHDLSLGDTLSCTLAAPTYELPSPHDLAEEQPDRAFAENQQAISLAALQHVSSLGMNLEQYGFPEELSALVMDYCPDSILTDPSLCTYMLEELCGAYVRSHAIWHEIVCLQALHQLSNSRLKLPNLYQEEGINVLGVYFFMFPAAPHLSVLDATRTQLLKGIQDLTYYTSVQGLQPRACVVKVCRHDAPPVTGSTVNEEPPHKRRRTSSRRGVSSTSMLVAHENTVVVKMRQTRAVFADT